MGIDRQRKLGDCITIKHEYLSSGQLSIEAALEVNIGTPLPKGHQIVHLCGNENCCNPWHLVNDVDKHLFNILNDPEYVYEHPTGEQNINSKLTEEDVLQIAKLIRAGVSQRPIARQFNTSQQAISSIATGRTWSEVTGFTKPDAADAWERLRQR
jgi:hypothetical protein